MADNIVITAELRDLVSGHLRDITSQVDRLENSLRDVGGRSGRGGGMMGQVLGANLLTGAINRAGSAVMEFGKEAIDSYGTQEQFLVSLKTMFHGNMQEAKNLNAQLQEFAKATPFELTEIQAATKMMIAYGSTSGGVIKELTMLGDVGSGVGSSLSEIGYLYGTLRTQGRAFSKDIYQFTGRGIPIVKELAKQFKVTDSEVMKLVESGKVGFKEVEKAFQSMTSEGGQFFNMMKEQSGTLKGQTSNLADAWDQLKAGLAESQSGILKNTVSWASDMVSAIGEIIKRDNYRENTNKKLGQSGIQTGMFDSWTDDRDRRYGRVDNNGNIVGNLTKEQAYFDKALGKVQYYAEQGARGQFEAFTNKIYDQVKAAKPEDAEITRTGFVELFRSLESDLQKNQMSPQMFNSKAAVLNEAISSMTEMMRQQRKSKVPGVTEAAEKKASDLEKVVKANRPTQINIDIENLVREYKPQVADNGKEIYKVTQQDVTKALLAAVNDISVLQSGGQ